jgi:hypothetical protein
MRPLPAAASEVIERFDLNVQGGATGPPLGTRIEARQFKTNYSRAVDDDDHQISCIFRSVTYDMEDCTARQDAINDFEQIPIK